MKILTCAIFVAAGFLALIPAHSQTVLPISPRFPRLLASRSLDGGNAKPEI